MNKAMLIGRLTRDPEVKYTQSNKAVASFTLAVDRRKSKNQQSSNQPTADFISCVAWDKLADVLSKYAGKGKQVGIEGRIQTRSWEAQDGTKRYATEVIVENLQLLDYAKNGGSSQQQPSSSSGSFGEPANDDDIPF